MAKRSHRAPHNALIGSLSDTDLRRQGFEKVALHLGDTLARSGDVLRYAYFPLEGIISAISSTNRGQSIEVATIGKEGMAAGVSAAVREESRMDFVVQVAGSALRLDGTRLRGRIEQSSSFRQRWLEYLHRLIGDIAQAAVCNRYHTGERRLARWLLTVADRAEADTIPLTHEFAANFVGGNRARVSMALGSLSERRLVEHRRGQVRIIDRPGLTKAACECYLKVAPTNYV